MSLFDLLWERRENKRRSKEALDYFEGIQQACSQMNLPSAKKVSDESSPIKQTLACPYCDHKMKWDDWFGEQDPLRVYECSNCHKKFM